MLKKSLLIFIFSIIFWVFTMTQADVDLWGHLKFGLDAIEAKQVIKIDPYSFMTQGQEWINHEWMAEVTFGTAWLAAQSLGLVIVKLLVGLVVAAILYIYLARNTNEPVVSALLVLLSALVIETDIITVRPQIFTVLCFTLTMLVIINAEKQNYRWLWLLPPVFLVWVNFHGGFLAGWGILLAWTIVHLLTHRSAWKNVLPPVLLSSLATLVNPYGLRLVTFLLQTATLPRMEIWEWTAVTVFEPLGWLYLGMVTLSALAIINSTQKKSPALLVLYFIVVLLPLIARRHLSLFAIGILFLAGEEIVQLIRLKIHPWFQKRTFPAWLAIFPLFAAGTFILFALPRLNQVPILPEPPFPIQAVELMRASGVTGNLAVEFSWGEYVIWHLSEQVKVSVDGRRETVYSPEVYQQNLNFLFGVFDWDEILRTYPIDLILISKMTPTFNLMEVQSGWTIVYEDEVSALFTVSGSNQEKLIQSSLGGVPLPETDMVFP
jgi:hypothetical protein